MAGYDRRYIAVLLTRLYTGTHYIRIVLDNGLTMWTVNAGSAIKLYIFERRLAMQTCFTLPTINVQRLLKVTGLATCYREVS